MSNWPTRVIGIEENSPSIRFSPSAAKSQGYAVYPLAEIDPEDIIDALSEDFGVEVDHIYLAKIEIKSGKNEVSDPLNENMNFAIMHQSIFLNEIHSGVYLEALFIADGILLIMLGGDESWIVLDPERFSHNSSELNQLMARSKENIQVLKKVRDFERFLCP